MNSCRLCGSHSTEVLIQLGAHPIAHHFGSEPDVFEPTYPLDLAICRDCMLLQISEPIAPDVLYKDYHVLSSFKPEPHMPRSVAFIESMKGVCPTSKILEVGCNDGGFMNSLAHAGYTNVLGIEPSKDAFEVAKNQGLNVRHEFFSSTSANNLVANSGQFDVFVCRQVLEHISDLNDFATAISLCLKPGGFALIEVPHAGMMLHYSDYSSIWEEHVNYFTLDTLKTFLRRIGIHIIHSETALFSGEILIAVGQRELSSKESMPVVSPSTQSSEEGSAAKLSQYQQALLLGKGWPSFKKRFVTFLAERKERGLKTFVYGAGCRSCSLINFTGAGPFIEAVLDDQGWKQGRFLPGSRLKVTPSSFLSADAASLCLLAVNAENEGKVTSKHADYVRRGGQFFSMCPPSSNLWPGWRE